MTRLHLHGTSDYHGQDSVQDSFERYCTLSSFFHTNIILARPHLFNQRLNRQPEKMNRHLAIMFNTPVPSDPLTAFYTTTQNYVHGKLYLSHISYLKIPSQN